jgi:small subunit ribosomal protein S21
MRDNTQNNKLTKGLVVHLREGEPIEKAIRKLKKKVQDSKLMETLRAKEFYEKPTSIRKRKKSAAKARWKKYLRSQELPPKHY